MNYRKEPDQGSFFFALVQLQQNYWLMMIYFSKTFQSKTIPSPKLK